MTVLTPAVRPRIACGTLGMIVLFAAAILPESASPTVAAEPTMTQFIKIRAPFSGQLSPDGAFYFIHNPDGTYQLFRRAAGGGPDAPAVQLTRFADGISRYSMSDDGRWLVISASKGGDEQDDLYLLSADGGEPEPILADPGTVYGSVVWQRDSKGFAYRSNEDNKRDFHIYVYDIAARKTRRVLAEKGYWYPADFSGSHDRLLVGKYNSATHSQVFEVVLATGIFREVTPVGEKWSFGPIGYFKGDRQVAVATNYRGDLTNLKSIDLASSEITPLLPQYDKMEVDGAEFNPDRTILAVQLNEDGYGTLKLHDAATHKPLAVPAMDRGLVGNVDFTGRELLFSLNNARSPGIIYRWSLDQPGSTPIAMTVADTQGVDLEQCQLPELIRYSTFDKKIEVPAFLYLPKGYAKGTPIPFIVSYHGGPEGQYRPSFSRSFQYFLSRGFGILAPNVRGSRGYGKAYLEMDNYKKRMDSVMDGVWAARWLVRNGYSQPGMIGAYGGSYGGFMAVATVAQAPALFGASCNVVGIVNFKTFLERTKAYRRQLREVEYGPLTDPEFLESISPIRLIERINTPMLIAHGRNDPRVPVHEAEQLHEALKERGRTVEMLIFDDEGHGFRKEKNRIEFYEKLAEFFQRHLQESTPAERGAATG